MTDAPADQNQNVSDMTPEQTEAPMTVADAAVAYARRGWKPVPFSRKTKKPIGNDWQKREFDARAFNGNAQNVGVQLGAESDGLTDVDLDTTAAIGFAPEFLPPTAAIFGRRSKPASHQLYVTDLHKTEKKAAIQYKDSTGAVIVELRIGPKNSDLGPAAVDESHWRNGRVGRGRPAGAHRRRPAQARRAAARGRLSADAALSRHRLAPRSRARARRRLGPR
jgi:hypothetical protein